MDSLMDVYLDLAWRRRALAFVREIAGTGTQELLTWMRHQDELQRLLRSRERLPEAMALFLRQHTAIHSANLAGSSAWSLEDAVLDGLDEGQIRCSPGSSGGHGTIGTNSVAWTIWHVARSEDLTINLFVADGTQVLNHDWVERMGLSRMDIGTGMSEGEVGDLSECVNIAEVRAYRAAVRRQTDKTVAALRGEDLEQRLSKAALEKMWAADALDPRANGLVRFWKGKKKRFFLTMPATRHAFIHLVEALLLKQRLLEGRLSRSKSS